MEHSQGIDLRKFSMKNSQGRLRTVLSLDMSSPLSMHLIFGSLSLLLP